MFQRKQRYQGTVAVKYIKSAFQSDTIVSQQNYQAKKEKRVQQCFR